MPQYSQNSHLSIAISFTVATHTSGWLHSERHSIATLGQPRSFSTSCSLLGSSIEPLIDPGNALWEIRFITWDRRNMIKGISNSSSSSTWSWEPTRETIEQREQHTPGSSQTAHCSNNTTIRTVGLEVLRGHSHSHSHSVTIRWICANISIVFGPQVALRTFATWKCSKYKTTTTIRVTATTINIFIAHEIGFLCTMESTQRETSLLLNKLMCNLWVTWKYLKLITYVSSCYSKFQIFTFGISIDLRRIGWHLMHSFLGFDSDILPLSVLSYYFLLAWFFSLSLPLSPFVCYLLSPSFLWL